MGTSNSSATAGGAGGICALMMPDFSRFVTYIYVLTIDRVGEQRSPVMEAEGGETRQS